jgi:Xaa-Pro aminopeptidase
MKLPLLLYRDEHFNANFFHYSGVDIDHSFLLVEKDSQTLLVPRMNQKAAKEQFSGTVIPYADPLIELKKLLKGRKVRVDGFNVRFGVTQKLKTFCRLDDVSIDLLKNRMLKTQVEVNKIKKAAELTKEIIQSLEIKKGKTEAQIKKQLMIETLERGLEPAFAPIIAADRNSSFPHYQTGSAKIKRMVLIDYGVKYGNYCSDLTRCFFVDAPEEKAIYLALQEIFGEIIGELPSIRTGGELARFCAKLFKKAKLPELPHAIGHGIGLDVHEFPRMGPKSKDHLHGATMAIEPSAYFDQYGLRFEETIYFDGKKARVL